MTPLPTPPRRAPADIGPDTINRMAALTARVGEALDEALSATIAPHAHEPYVAAAVVGGVAMLMVKFGSPFPGGADRMAGMVRKITAEIAAERQGGR